MPRSKDVNPPSSPSRSRRRATLLLILGLLGGSILAGGLVACGEVGGAGGRQSNGRKSSGREAGGRESAGRRNGAVPKQAGGERLETKRLDVRTDGAYGYRDLSRRPVAKQAVYLLLKAVDFRSVPFATVRHDLEGSVRGVSFGHVAHYLGTLGLESTLVEESLEKFAVRGRPGIIAVKPLQRAFAPEISHFILVRRIDPDGACHITDPLRGAMTVPMAQLAEGYRGAVLFLTGDPARPKLDAPDIAIDEMLWHYGTVESGTLVRHTFRVANQGGRDLKIMGILPSCGCLATPIHAKRDDEIANPKGTIKRDPKTGQFEVDYEALETSRVVPPGGECFVTGFYDTTNRAGYRPASFQIRSNDPDEPTVELVVEGNVSRAVEMDPPAIYWREIPANQGAEAMMWIRRLDGKPLDVTGMNIVSIPLAVTVAPDADRAAPSPESLPAGVEPKAHPADAGWIGLRVKLRGGLEVGRYQTVVLVNARGVAAPISFGVWGDVVGSLRVSPAALSYGRVKLGEEKVANLEVSSPGTKGFAVSRVTTTIPKLLDYDVSEPSPGVFRVSVRLKKGWQAPALRGEVTIHSNDPLEPERTILVSGFVHRAFD